MILKEVYNNLRRKLSEVSECPEFEAQELIKKAYGISTTDILTKGVMHVDEQIVHELLAKRLEHYPLQYILGEWEFFGNRFKVNEDTLIPRPETEILCECFADEIKALDAPVVLDLCSGSGCIAVSIAKLCENCTVTAVEKYEKTVSILRENTVLNGVDNVQIVCGDIENSSLVLPMADFIVSNPPYICTGELKTLQAEVHFEPSAALDGGEDGLYFYRCIRDNCLRFLKSGGMCAFECGDTQMDEICKVFSSLSLVRVIKDYSGKERVAVFKKVVN